MKIVGVGKFWGYFLIFLNNCFFFNLFFFFFKGGEGKSRVKLIKREVKVDLKEIRN